MTDKISKWEEEARLAEEKAKELKRKIRLEKKAQQEKLALAIGSAVLSATDVKSVAEFEEKYLAHSSDFSNGSIISANESKIVELSYYEEIKNSSKKEVILIRFKGDNAVSYSKANQIYLTKFHDKI